MLSESHDLTTIRLRVHATTKRTADVISQIIVETETVEDKIWRPCCRIERGSA